MDLQNEIKLKVALPLIAVVLIVITAAGLTVGNVFFWNNFDSIDPIAKDIQYFEELLKEKPGHQPYLIELGWLYYRNGEYEKASSLLASVINESEDCTQARYILGLTLIELDKPQQACEEFKKVIAMEPDHQGAYHDLGRAYILQRNWDDAIAQLEQAAKIDPVSADNYYYLGMAYEQKGFRQEAKSFYEKALRYVPQYIEAQEAYDRIK